MNTSNINIKEILYGIGCIAIVVVLTYQFTIALADSPSEYPPASTSHLQELCTHGEEDACEALFDRLNEAQSDL